MQKKNLTIVPIHPTFLPPVHAVYNYLRRALTCIPSADDDDGSGLHFKEGKSSRLNRNRPPDKACTSACNQALLQVDRGLIGACVSGCTP